MTVCREDMHLPDNMVSDEQLEALFHTADEHGGGSFDYNEFSNRMGETDLGKPDVYLSMPQKARKDEVGDELLRTMGALQVCCKGRIDPMGWKA